MNQPDVDRGPDEVSNEGDLLLAIDENKNVAEQCRSLVERTKNAIIKNCREEDVLPAKMSERLKQFITALKDDDEPNILTVVGDSGVGKSAFINLECLASEPPKQQVSLCIPLRSSYLSFASLLVKCIISLLMLLSLWSKRLATEFMDSAVWSQDSERRGWEGMARSNHTSSMQNCTRMIWVFAMAGAPVHSRKDHIRGETKTKISAQWAVPEVERSGGPGQEELPLTDACDTKDNQLVSRVHESHAGSHDPPSRELIVLESSPKSSMTIHFTCQYPSF